MLISVIANEIKVISLFYYRNPYVHLSLTTSIYFYESLLDLTLNCFLYTEQYISEEYHNGTLKFITSLYLSLASNIVSSIISYYTISLVEFSELLELIINNVYRRRYYYLNIIKFKKYLIIKLTFFYIIQILFNTCMCYYLTIFCVVYHQTQKNVILNYILGIIESLSFSLGLSIIIAFLRFISIKMKNKTLYNTSKYLFEKF